jgi:hypothetical protein
MGSGLILGGRNVPGPGDESPTKMIFMEKLNKQGNKTIIVELFYQGKSMGTFIKKKSNATELGKED